ncbi:MAG: NAD-glutamate dehydrogenase, partial [Pelagibacterales bacterium]|nr:NAD-glutamate dehydrogenase [Pelagibacterales bacterium]
MININVENEDSDYAILTVVCYDAPFIIDSINNELQTHDIDINLLTHKVFDQKDYVDYKFTHLKRDKIAALQFYISNWFDSDFYKSLKTKIIGILECTYIAVNDWKKMKESLSVCIKNSKDNFNLNKISELNQEHINFLEFLIDDNFIFLGYCYSKLDK